MELFTVEPTLHAALHMPVLVRTKQVVVVLPEVCRPDSSSFLNSCELKDIECAVNLQHDCYHGKCGPQNSISILQEREVTSIPRAIIRHADDERFIVNTTSLRNYRQIASAIPVSILAHKFTANDLAALRASGQNCWRLAGQPHESCVPYR
jgi:hypothetical protein